MTWDPLSGVWVPIINEVGGGGGGGGINKIGKDNLSPGKNRPRGRAPEGKTWDIEMGQWIEKDEDGTDTSKAGYDRNTNRGK